MNQKNLFTSIFLWLLGMGGLSHAEGGQDPVTRFPHGVVINPTSRIQGTKTGPVVSITNTGVKIQGTLGLTLDGSLGIFETINLPLLTTKQRYTYTVLIPTKRVVYQSAHGSSLSATGAIVEAQYIVPQFSVIRDVRALSRVANNATTGITLDVNKNGTTIFTTQGDRPIILTNATASSTTLPAVTTLAAGDRVSWDADNLGVSSVDLDYSFSVTADLMAKVEDNVAGTVVPRKGTLAHARFWVGQVPTGVGLTIRGSIQGTAKFTLGCAAGATLSATVAVGEAIAAGDAINFDILTVGTSHPGGDVTIAMIVDEDRLLESSTTRVAEVLVARAGTAIDVRAYAQTVPTGNGLTLRVNINGTASGTLSIAASANISNTLTTATAIAQGDRISVDVITAGSTIAGGDVTVCWTLRRTTF